MSEHVFLHTDSLLHKMFSNQFILLLCGLFLKSAALHISQTDYTVDLFVVCGPPSQTSSPNPGPCGNQSSELDPLTVPFTSQASCQLYGFEDGNSQLLPEERRRITDFYFFFTVYFKGENIFNWFKISFTMYVDLSINFLGLRILF